MIRIAVCDDDELYITKTIKPLLMKAQKVVGIQIDVKFFPMASVCLRSTIIINITTL